MNLTRRDFLAMFLYDYEKQFTADECFTSLIEGFRGPALSRATVGN